MTAVYFDRRQPTRNPAPSLLPRPNLHEALEQIAGDDEVRCFIGWYRHITLVLLALAFLTGICTTVCGSPAPPATSEPPPRPPVLSLTVPEVRHLLARLIWPSPSNVKRALDWSWWRRCHRGAASYYHTKRRLKAG